LILSDMQARVSERLAEGGGAVFYPAAEITAALNEASRLFCLLTLGLEKTATWSVPAATTFTHMLGVFSDWICPLRITDAAGAKIRPSRLEDLASLDSGWLNSPGAPYRYVAAGADFVGVYRQPAASGTVLTVTYAKADAALASAGDAPATPAEYHPKYVDYAIYRLRQAEGAQEFQKALPLLGSFFDAAKHYAAYVRSRNLGSRYDKVPFEIESYDTSKLLKLRRDLVPIGKPPET
jgi:hypothetical protein